MVREVSGDERWGRWGKRGKDMLHGSCSKDECAVGTGEELKKRSETGLGLGGWSEVRSYLRTGQHRAEAERAKSGREGEERGWK